MVAVSETQKPLTVPKELLTVAGGLSPNLLIFVSAVAIALFSVIGFLQFGLPGWACFVLNTLALHLCGTVIHDACHHSAHRNRIVNAILGHGSALMLCFSFPVFTRVHLQHHAHVNHPKDDPDHFVSTGGPLWLIAPRFFYHEIFFFQRKLWRKYELLEWFIARLIVGTIVYVSLQYQFFDFIMTYWFLPDMVVGLALGLFFDYLPHRPFQEQRDRWTNARVYPNPLLNLLIMGQNYHLVHHLWPSVPWYNYQPTYYAMKPELDAHNSPQTLGIWQGRDFWEFLYDVFLGIRFHQHSED